MFRGSGNEKKNDKNDKEKNEDCNEEIFACKIYKYLKEIWEKSRKPS